MNITETQLSNFKKYISVLLSEGMGNNDYSSRIATLKYVSDKNNGLDNSGTAHIEFVTDLEVYELEYKVSNLLFRIEQFKSQTRDLDSEYNDFLLNLDIDILRYENDLVKLQNPENHREYKNKTKSFINMLKRDKRKTIKYIKNLKK